MRQTLDPKRINLKEHFNGDTMEVPKRHFNGGINQSEDECCLLGNIEALSNTRDKGHDLF